MARVKLLYNTGSSAQGSVMTQRGGMGWEGKREDQEGGDTCRPMADSHCCMAETNTTS